jgi:hypothetical protein
MNDTHLKLSGTIEVKTWEPRPYDVPAAGLTLNEIHVTETFHGDIEAEGTVRFLQAARADGSASFTGLERVTGTFAGRAGSLLLMDFGSLVGNEVTGRFTVVSGSGTGALAGVEGEGTFGATLGQHARWTLELKLP